MRFKRWLFERFLPAWCREELLEQNERLRSRIAAQQQEIERLEAYIEGMRAALRRQPKIVIEGEKKT